jgi:sulfoxide reductase catalytic subunit YedY
MKNKIISSEITPKSVYINRRRFFKNSAQYALAAYLAASCAPRPKSLDLTPTEAIQNLGIEGVDEMGNPLTPRLDILGYTNFYEFSTAKSEPTKLAKDFKTDPWTVEIGGLVKNPMTIDLDQINKDFDTEERIYRLRCVEAWSMVIPWVGFPLKDLLDKVEPTSKAKYVRFETLFDPTQMPGQASPFFPWPYVEGLRLDEAMHDLTFMATGLYGEPLHPQNGAPIRLVVPWKYGFKSIKSIVRIDLVEEMPKSLWMASSPNEYGFFANVNPQVNHPRWSQANERRIGTGERIETTLFNGYAEEVAHLYNGMDLSIYY